MNQPMRIQIHASGRAKSHSRLYFCMCASSLVRYRALANKLRTLNLVSNEYDSTFEQTEAAAIELVVFAGMALEATLFDLGACLFGDNFAAYLDKLDPIGKFVVIAQCVDRSIPSESNITIQSIKALVEARNKLVHSKSSPLSGDGLMHVIDKAQKQHTQHVHATSSSFRALVLLSLYFDGNIFEELRILPSFKKPEYWTGIIPHELHADVNWCIEKARKEKSASRKINI